MWLVSLAALVVASFCGGVLLRFYLARRNPVFLAWSVAVILIAVASACAAIGSYGGWTETTAKIYYLTAAILFAGFMSLGSVYLNAPRVIGHVWLVILLAVAVFGAVVLAGSGVDGDALALADEPGWSAIEASWLLSGTVTAFSSVAILILVVAAVAGVVYRRAGTEQVAVAVGVLVVGLAGALARLDDWEWASAGQAFGIVIIAYGAAKLFRRPVADIFA